jgi:hypothetical protein
MDEQPRIPVLDDLGGRLERAFRDGERARVRRPRRLRWRLALALAALGMLAVPTAIGTQTIWAPGADVGRGFGDAHKGSPVRVAEGEDQLGRWWLVAQQTSDGLCVGVASNGGWTGTCNGRVPDPEHVTVGVGTRYFGWTSRRAASVRIATGSGTLTLKTFAPATAAYRRGGFSLPFRLFVAPAPNGSPPMGPLRIDAVDRAGRVIGRLP